MFVQRRIHQDQLQSVSKMMKLLYNEKRPDRHDNPDSQIDKRTGSRNCSQGSFSQHATGGNLSRKNVPAMPFAKMFAKRSIAVSLSVIKNDSARTCRHCGEKFPHIDNQYTENSGLCIPCWEAEAAPCQ